MRTRRCQSALLTAFATFIAVSASAAPAGVDSAAVEPAEAPELVVAPEAAQDSTISVATEETIVAKALDITPIEVPSLAMPQGPSMSNAISSLHLELAPDTTLSAMLPATDVTKPLSIYALPYSRTLSSPDWHRLWVNTAVLSSAFVGTLLVLECLPEDATTWNRAELQKVPLFKRWWDHVVVKGPEWDHDSPIFNYVLHPYAGAVYFMAARSNGFNYYQSLLYSAIVSTVGWEFGIEAFMERPSIQDIFITPLVGSAIGEGFYHIKRKIVENGYELLGSKVLGNIVAVLIDPVNEIVGFVGGNPARKVAQQHVRFTPGINSMALSITF